MIRRSGLPFGLNVVPHRHNLDHLDGLIDLALAWGAERLELANTQFYGWALRNRAALMPAREQLARAHEVVKRRESELTLIWVLPDYITGSPKPCMGGWAARSLTVAPDGTALPCPAAHGIGDPPNVRDRPLAWIWRDSPLFNAYRGTDWMTGPCRGCPRRHADFGGCRCQAHALTGDAARTDPACALAPDHALIERAIQAPPAAFAPRRPR